MQFIHPTPVQAAALPIALEGGDILATADTGTGKTGAFGVPLLAAITKGTKRQALILAPTRELAAQIHSVLRQMGQGLPYRSALVVGGESFHRQQHELSRGVHYIVATPGRLTDHLHETNLDLSAIDLLVLDEVDRMLDMGFAPQIREIMKFVPKKRQTLLFSATLPQEIQSLANQFLQNPTRIEIAKVVAAEPQITEQTIQTTQNEKNRVVLKELEERQGRILIFARTKHRTDRLARFLYDEGHGVVCLHGGKTQGQRKQALERFRSGTRRIMVATDLAGRGIDVPDIEHVINYDLPPTREDYIHRIGRTGRYGRTGCAVNLLTTGDFEGERVISGKKAVPRTVFKSSRRRFRR